MINEEFLSFLAYALCIPEKDPACGQLGGFSCDGVYGSCSPEYSKEVIKNEGFIELDMDFGKRGWEPYKLILYFGKKARHRSARGLSLEPCVPNFCEEQNAITIDEENKIVEIQLK
jgi:hypothetical protein